MFSVGDMIDTWFGDENGQSRIVKIEPYQGAYREHFTHTLTLTAPRTRKGTIEMAVNMRDYAEGKKNPMGIQAKLKKVGSKFELYVGKTLHGVFGSIGAAAGYLKKEFGKAFVPAPKGAKNPWHGGTQPARGKDYVGPKSGWVQVYKGSPINAKSLANHLERSHNIPAKTVKSGIMSAVKIKLANISAAKRVVADFKSELGAAPKGAKNPLGNWRYEAKVSGIGSHKTNSLQEAISMGKRLAGKHGRFTVTDKMSGHTQEHSPIKNPGCKVGRRKNVAMGKTVGKGKNRRFFPFRSSSDYDPTLLHDAEGQRARSEKRKHKAKKTRKAVPVRKGSKRSSMTRYRATQNPSHINGEGLSLMEWRYAAGITKDVAKMSQKEYNAMMRAWRAGEDPTEYRAPKGAKGAKKSNPGKRKIPAAFKAAAERAKSMTPAQRAAWAKKMQAARAAKRRGR